MKSVNTLFKGGFPSRNFSRTMKAIVFDSFGGPEVMKVSDKVEIPELKGNQMLLRIEATAVNRADTMQVSMILFKWGRGKVDTRHLLGHLVLSGWRPSGI